MQVSILLAITEPTFSQGIRNVLSKGGLEVIEDEVYHRKYLNDTIELNSPSMVIIHDLYLPSDLSDPTERDMEMLQLIEYWRSVYDNDLRVVYLCIRERQDPFLSQLVARNVLDIFNERTMSQQRMVEQLSSPARFKNVQRFGTGNIEVELFEEESTTNIDELKEESTNNEEILVQSTGDEAPAKEKGEFAKKLTDTATKLGSQLTEGAKKGAKLGMKGAGTAVKGAGALKDMIPKVETDGNANTSQDLMLNDLMDLMPVEVDVTKIPKPAIIGTVLIAVAGVRPHLGSTHTSLSIASFLQNLGHSVAVIESNYSEDFDRIHALYEGETQLLKKDNYFELSGIHHYKYREDFNLNELYSLYEYVIMDFGDLDDAAGYVEEFQRAHVKCVICSGDEWKKHWIDDFLRKNRLMKNDCAFIIPNGGNEKTKDLQERMDYLDIWAFPSQDNPYETIGEAEDVVTELLGSFIKSPNRSFSKQALIVTSVISVAVTAVLVTIFNYL